MKKEYYSTSLVEAKGRGEIFKDNVKILEFENDLTWSAKKDIVNLICGQPLGTSVDPGATKLQSINQIGLLCYRIDKDHGEFTGNPNTSQTVKGYTAEGAPSGSYMNAFTGYNESANDSLANKQFVHKSGVGDGQLRKFGRCINGDEAQYRDWGEGFGIGRPAKSGDDAHLDKTDKTSKFASSLTVGFNNVTFGFDTLTGNGQEHLVWSDLWGSGGTGITDLSDFSIEGTNANDGYLTTTGLKDADLSTGYTVLLYRADQNIAGAGGALGQSVEELGHLLSGERCILVGAYLMEHTAVENVAGNVDGNDNATDFQTAGSTRAIHLNVAEDTSSLTLQASNEPMYVYNDVYWTQDSMFSGKYLTEQTTSSEIVQISPNDTVKGTYTIDFTPSSGKFGNPTLESDVWNNLNCARLGTSLVPSICISELNGGLPDVGVQGCCDWSVALAQQFWAISSSMPWATGTPSSAGSSDKSQKLVDEFTTQEWSTSKVSNQDGLESTPANLMPGRITHVAVADNLDFLCSVKEVSNSGGVGVWENDVDPASGGDYSNTCQVDFGNIDKPGIKNRLFFYSAGNVASADIGGNHTPLVGDPINHEVTVDANGVPLGGDGLRGGMFPIQVTKLKEIDFDEVDIVEDTIPSWNPKDKLIVNFKIQWG